MRTAPRIAVATAVVWAGCLFGPAGPASASSEATAGVRGEVTVADGTVVTTAHVPTSADPVQVARSYDYRLEVACWSTGTGSRPTRVRTVATARVPSGPGAFQLRVPPDLRTSFSFSDPVAALARTGTSGAGAPCPGKSVSAPYRLSVGAWEVTVTHLDGSTEQARGTSGGTWEFPAPVATTRRPQR